MEKEKETKNKKAIKKEEKNKKEKQKTKKNTSKVKKKEKAPINYLYDDKINISIEEVNRIFPSTEKQENKDNKNDNKDYIIIKQENGKIDELNRYKYLYDLFIWKKFFSVCSEVDNAFIIKDDAFEKSIKNGNCEDITIRDVKYKRQNKIYSDEIINKYNKRLYDEYVKERTIDSENLTRNDEYVKKNRNIYLVSSIILFLCSIFILIPFSFLNNLFSDLLKYILFSIGIILTAFFLILFIKHKKIAIIKKDENIKTVNNNLKSFDEFIKEKETNEEYIIKIEDIKKRYLDELKRKEEIILKYREVLIYIKEKLIALIPLAKDVYNEDMILSLINISIERNCDTIRKSMRLSKEDEYQSEYLSSLDLFSKSMFYLEDYKIFIDEYNNLKLDLKNEFDEKMNNNNIIYEYLNNIKINKMTIDDEKYLN